MRVFDGCINIVAQIGLFSGLEASLLAIYERSL